jgi:hypothetical protein
MLAANTDFIYDFGIRRMGRDDRSDVLQWERSAGPATLA